MLFLVEMETSAHRKTLFFVAFFNREIGGRSCKLGNVGKRNLCGKRNFVREKKSKIIFLRERCLRA